MPETSTETTKTRRVWTPKMKARVIAYAREHGPQATREHFRIAGSMLRRWKGENGHGDGTHETPAPRARRKWTPKKIARVLEYKKTHTGEETRKRFGISSAQLHYWRLSGGTSNGPSRAKGLKRGPKPLTGQIEAVIHLERWRTARLEFIRAGGEPSEYDLDAELALRALRSQ